MKGLNIYQDMARVRTYSHFDEQPLHNTACSPPPPPQIALSSICFVHQLGISLNFSAMFSTIDARELFSIDKLWFLIGSIDEKFNANFNEN